MSRCRWRDPDNWRKVCENDGSGFMYCEDHAAIIRKNMLGGLTPRDDLAPRVERMLDLRARTYPSAVSGDVDDPLLPLEEYELANIRRGLQMEADEHPVGIRVRVDSCFAVDITADR